MKAFLLAAGLGTRLYPLTLEVPKCLVPIQGRPLLEIWLNLLNDSGVTDVLINTHYLAPQVTEFATRWRGRPSLSVAYEPSLLGSAGTLARNWSFVRDEESFLVCYADNLTDIDLGGLCRYHQAHDGMVTVALFRTENPRECGVVEIGRDGKLLSFEEKPVAPRSTLANAGIYVVRQGLRPFLPDTLPSDIGRDLLPRCVGSAYGWIWDGLLIDIGTPPGYARAQQSWAAKCA